MSTTNCLSPQAAQTFIEALPHNIRAAVLAYAVETDYPVEAVLEMAIAFFLDMDCAGFGDCRTESPGQMLAQIELLQAQQQDR
ncbi:hypothetical protein IQ266_12100 [filamentous cyanobacterium LEGE 11480]|uniref:Uncharacterized protein n=1 Tax=Romeriopsis navalis LEGE 11480 TaxID=2777977 RepID=A0A928VML5_9CYAN|nr:hypothetical protein [Romeriopsis navalis]MBE9030473.1 hypothetical protein [Romeriopsis navalis LEGE 11480]